MTVGVHRLFLPGCMALLSFGVFAQAQTGGANGKFDPRDLSGVWSTLGSSIPNNDITQHMLPGEEIAFTPYGAERYRKLDHAADLTNRCGPSGYFRGMQSPLMPFQIIQGKGVTAIPIEYMYTFRLIYTDGRGHPEDIADYPEWMGHSIGRWEGDTFVVESVGFNDKTWLDTSGLEHSDKLKVVERFRRTEPDNIRWTVTVTDPVFFTKPFTYAFDFKRQDTRILSYSCSENEKDADHMLPTLGGAHGNTKVLKFPSQDSAAQPRGNR
jgi:hypothetical protein